MRDVADLVGITERAVQQIVRDLVEQGFVCKVKHGRRNRYHIASDAHLRHDLEAGVSLESFVAFMTGRHGEAPRSPTYSPPPEPSQARRGVDRPALDTSSYSRIVVRTSIG